MTNYWWRIDEDGMDKGVVVQKIDRETLQQLERLLFRGKDAHDKALKYVAKHRRKNDTFHDMA